MSDLVVTLAFDLLNLVGVVMSVWPMVSMRRADVARAVTVGRLAHKDTEEVIPQVKWSLTGLISLVAFYLAKAAYLCLHEVLAPQSNEVILLSACVAAAVMLTVAIRLMIDRYWEKYDFQRERERWTDAESMKVESDC